MLLEIRSAKLSSSSAAAASLDPKSGFRRPGSCKRTRVTGNRRDKRHWARRARRPMLGLMSAAASAFGWSGMCSAREGPALEISGSIGLATENVARGISYSNEKPSISGRFLVTKGDIEVAGSAVSVSGGTATVELAMEARVVKRFGTVEFRLAVERTIYPGAGPGNNYWEFGAGVRRQTQGMTLEAAARVSPDDAGGAKYYYAEVNRTVVALGAAEFFVRSRVGRRTYDDNLRAGQPDYWHGLAAIGLRRRSVTFEAAFHDTDLPEGTFFPSGPRVAARVIVSF